MKFKIIVKFVEDVAVFVHSRTRKPLAEHIVAALVTSPCFEGYDVECS